MTPACRQVVELMKGLGRETRTVEVSCLLGISQSAAYKRLARLRREGVIASRLDWVRLPNGCHAPKVEDGQRKLMSWLWYWLRPEQEWGQVPYRGEWQRQFDRMKHKGG